MVVVIVSYGNPADVKRCLGSLSRSSWADFAVFVCENAGQEAFNRLRSLLTGENGPLERDQSSLDTLDKPAGRLAIVTTCRFRGRAIAVRLAAASENLGYAGGINAWLERLSVYPGWEAALVLNPDTVVAETCLLELMTKAAEGFGMVGGTLVLDASPDRIFNYGLHWSRRTGRTIGVGRNFPAAGPPSAALLASIDAISGACMLVTRQFINGVGLMAEDYFLYMEDLDWGLRRGGHKIGFAHGAVVRHIGGTSIGSAADPKARSPLSVYLSSRNSVLFTRRWAGRRWTIHLAVQLLYVARYLLYGSLVSTKAALAGVIDGVRGKTGRPDMLVYHPLHRGTEKCCE